MKKLVIGLAALLILTGFVGWNVWQAVYEPVTTPPSLVDLGRQQLHSQLEQSKAREAEIEKQDWGSITLLRSLIGAHQHRIDQLKDNTQAGEIVAHDRDAIARIEKRIADLLAQQSAQPAAAPDQTTAESRSVSNPAVSSGGSGAAVIAPKNAPAQQISKPGQPQSTRPGATASPTPQTAKPAQKTQTPASPKPAPQAPPQSR